MIKTLLINNHLKLIRIVGNCLSTNRSNINLGDQMKILNDTKQFESALELFNKYKDKNLDKCSNWIIIQALRACTNLRDIEHGSIIHNLISSRLKYDSYVLPAIIHFY
ncbi:unnamed protein product, partial [Rotaria sp. Silwood1]